MKKENNSFHYLAMSILFAVLIVVTVLFHQNELLLYGCVIGYVFFSVKRYQAKTFYRCIACGETFNASFLATMFSHNLSKIKHVRCTKCGKKSWLTQL
ncbi:MAG: hypothetical protein GY765_38130 [bacterium]|nr:hypothetical protein [bacterium]